MTGNIRPFGAVDGAEVEEVTLISSAGAEARILTWGAIVRDLAIPTPNGLQPVVLGFERIEDYLSQKGYFGAIVGRYANRIGGARFRLDGETFQLKPNEGPNQLHGGPHGFARRLWSLVASDKTSACLELVSDDGEMGYPGRLVARCTYRLLEPATLRLELQATCDKPCPVNLTTHIYYNLNGAPDILEHRVTLYAGQVTPTDSELIPTGEVLSVTDTAYDFRTERAVGRQTEYDINYVLDRIRGVGLARGATVRSIANGVTLDLWTTEPGLQFYTGQQMDVTAPGLGGARYGRQSGLCLEPQRWPDGPNRSYFPPCILRPGESSDQTSELRFSVVG